MSVIKPQGRIAIGYATYGDQRVPVTIEIEWDRYLERLTGQINGLLGSALVGAQGAAGVSASMFGDDGGGDVEFVPGPKGDKGERGEPGPAIFLLEDPIETDVFWRV